MTEGQTEEGFVRDILAPFLGAHNVFADCHSITTGRHHGRLFRGGMVNYEHLARDLTIWMRQDQSEDSWFTTMVDFYSLPNNFPGHAALPLFQGSRDRLLHLEAELMRDIANRLSGLAVFRRLIPYIQLHEFEAVLFSDPAAFEEAFPDEPKVVAELASIRSRFPTPEDIDNDPITSPSRRILNILPDYQKPVAGVLIAKRIGITRIRRECPHFDEWLGRLLALSTQGTAVDPA